MRLVKPKKKPVITRKIWPPPCWRPPWVSSSIPIPRGTSGKISSRCPARSFARQTSLNPLSATRTGFGPPWSQPVPLSTTTTESILHECFPAEIDKRFRRVHSARLHHSSVSILIERELVSCTQDHIGEQFGHHRDLPITFVVDESLPSEFLHEKSYFRRRRPDDFGQLLVRKATNLYVSLLEMASFTGHFQKDTSQP